MKNVFLLAVMYGVQLTKADLTGLKNSQQSEEDFRKQHEIPQDVKADSAFKSDADFSLEDLIALANENKNGKMVDRLIMMELEKLEVAHGNAKGKDKEELEARIKTVESLNKDEAKPAKPEKKASKKGEKKDAKGAKPAKPAKEAKEAKPAKPAKEAKKKTEPKKPFEFTVKDVEKSDISPRHRKHLLLLSDKLTAEEIKKKHPELLDQYVYIPYTEYIDLLEVAKKYFAPQVKKAIKTLENKIS